jgi:hypothetical protein
MRWRYTLHLHDVVGRSALLARDPEAALVAADAELAGARRYHAKKVEARACVLRGDALLAMERRADAEETLRDAIRIAEEIAYPRATWEALGLLAEVARRAGRTEEAAHIGVRRRAVVEVAMGSLADADLRRELARSVGGD